MGSQGSTPAGTRVTGIVLAFTLIAGTVVCLRMYTRLVLTRVTGFEDVCIFLAMALSISLTVMTTGQVENGLGKHDWQLEPSQHLESLKAIWASLWIYSLALTFTKVSILVQYLRIFPVRRFQKVCYGVLAIVVVYGIWTVFGNIFLCNPIQSFWELPLDGGGCMDRKVVWFTNAAVNIAQDIVILLLPMPLIQTLQVSQGQKRGLVIMFGLGASVSMVSVIRLYSLHDIARSKDLSFDNPAHATLSAVEVNVAIICACLPAMRPLLALLMPKYFSAAAQYTNVPRKLDLDASWYRKDESKTFDTKTFDTKTFDTSRSNTPRTNTASTNHISRGGTPQAPRPTLSRNSIGHFIVNNGRSRRPEEPRKIIPPWETYNHSRAGSNISIDIAAAEARSSKRVQSRVHPLRMSPVRADNPLSPTRMSMQSIGHGFFTFKRSDTLRVMNPDQVRRSEMRMSVKPLPLTPFPVGAAI